MLPRRVDMFAESYSLVSSVSFAQPEVFNNFLDKEFSKANIEVIIKTGKASGFDES